MKRRVVSLIFVMFLIIFAGRAAAQEFPIGLYSGADTSIPLGSYITNIHDLGANMIVYPVKMYVPPTQQTSGLYQTIIPANAYNANDKVFHYSGGYWTTWTPKDSVPGVLGDEAKILKRVNGTLSNGEVNTGTQFNTSPVLIVSGPGFKQDYRYSRKKRIYDVNYPTNLINYQTVFTMRLGDTTDGNRGSGNALKVCEISAYVGDTRVMFREVFKNDLNLNGTDTKILLTGPNGATTYNYSGYITSAENGAERVGPIGIPNPSAVTETYDTVRFQVVWFGHWQIFVKQIDVYDDIIGNRLKNNYNDAKSEIEGYLNSTNGISTQFRYYTNIGAWYGLDEPATIDSYKPYSMVNSIVKDASVAVNARKPLITAFSPYYKPEGQYQGNRTFPRWLREARPDTLMFDFYPINRHVKATDNGPFILDSVLQQFNILRTLLQSANENIDTTITKKVFYAGQAHSFYDSDDATLKLYQPDTCQFKASSMLALAHGVKGLLFITI